MVQMVRWLVLVLAISSCLSQSAPNWISTALLGPKCLTARGFPASPKTIKPWISAWQNPPESHPQPVSTAFPYSVEYEGRKIEFHEIHAVNQGIQVFVPGKPTQFLAYKLPSAAAATVPGPTIRVCKGVTTLVRFKNFLEGIDSRFRLLETQGHMAKRGGPGPEECSGNFTNPWPIQVHLHGSGSLAPYDGWADSLIFSGCGKDFLYPNNRAGTSWYHDHTVHETAYNAYMGLAGHYWIDDCCSEMEDTLPSGPYRLPFIIRDAAFDANDQLLFDPAGTHRDDFYGDHVFVNGVPWPVLHVERRQYRFEIHVASVTRAMLLSFKDQPGSYFIVIGSDGGFRQDAVKTNSLRAAVAERWDVIIDFAQPAFQGVQEVILYDLPLYNMPIFCQSHLVAKFVIDLPTTPTTLPPPPKFLTKFFTPVPPLGTPMPPSTSSPFVRPLDPLRPVTPGEALLFQPKFQATKPIPMVSAHPLTAPLIPDSFLALAQDPKVDPKRKLIFDRSGGRWSIRTQEIVNGATITIGGGSQTWDSTANFDEGLPLSPSEQWTARSQKAEHITAEPGLNTLEVWEIKNGGGGWFHPIHIHLVDFFLAYRKGGSPELTLENGTDGLAPYERLSSKDVVFLGPGETLRVVARYGPHAGNYMMHCHNLIHEDNDMLVAFKVVPGKGVIFNPTDPSFGGLDLPDDPLNPLDDALSVPPVPIKDLPDVGVNYLASYLQSNIYRNIYPPEQHLQGYPVDWKAAPYFSQSQFLSPFVNPWEVPYIALDRPEVCPAFQAVHRPAPGATSFYAQVGEEGTVGAVTGVLQVTGVAGVEDNSQGEVVEPVHAEPVGEVPTLIKQALQKERKQKARKTKVIIVKL